MDTPKGMFTSAGVWFRTTEAMLHEYAGAVFDREPLERLLYQAEVWLRSAKTLTLWVLPVFLFLLPPAAVVAAALVVFVAWKTLGPSFVTRWLTKLFGWMDLVLLQAFYYVLMLSALAAQHHVIGVWVGLAGFILLRWNVVDWVAKPVVERIWATLYALPIPDQVLRALVIRAALAHGISLPELDRMEQQILDTWNKS